MEEVRCEAVFLAYESPVLMLRADCSLLALKSAHSSPYLPFSDQPYGSLKLCVCVKIFIRKATFIAMDSFNKAYNIHAK